MLTASAVGLWPAPPAAAQEDWKPFAEPDKRRPPRASARDAAQPPAADPRPTLPPMDGVNALRRDGPGAAPPAASMGPGSGAPSGSASAPLPAQAYGRAPWEEPAARPGSGPMVAPPSAHDGKIERSELAPVGGGTADVAALPDEAWRGLDAATFERLIANLSLPPRSPALHSLWRRLMTSSASVGASADGRRFLAVRAEALRRSGLVAEEARLLESAGEGDAVIAALKARSLVGIGDAGTGCEQVKAALPQKSALPTPLRAELMLMVGLCAAETQNPAGAGLAADLAREEGLDAAFGISVLDAIAASSKAKLTLPKSLSPTEYRLLARAGLVDGLQVLERATPALLAALAADAEAEPKLRIAAAESAARVNAVAPEQLGEVWRAQVFAPQDIADPLTAKVDPALRRALLFKAAEAERTPAKKTRVIRALLDDARRSGLYLPALVLLARQVDSLTPAEEIGWFAETAVETQLAAQSFDRARRWLAFAERAPGPNGGGALQHWLALADIADARMSGPRGASLGSVEALALRGRFSADLLHRLATVLDALDYHVPIPLWEAASKAPQPTTGHLPPTGVLSELQEAAKKRETGRTALLAMQALGPTGGEGAHIIALGDAIRALRRAGLDTESRRLGFEALLAGWPRAVTP